MFHTPSRPALCTGGRISVLREEFLYYDKNVCAAGRNPVPQEEFLYCGKNFCTGGRIPVLREDDDVDDDDSDGAARQVYMTMGGHG